MRWQFLVLAFLGLATAAHAETLTFEDIHGIGFLMMPSGYGGLDWSNFYNLDTTNPFGDNEANGYTSGTVSQSRVIGTIEGRVASISAPAFQLTSGYFTAAWSHVLQVTVTGYKDGTEVGQSIFWVEDYFPSHEVFDLGTVDEITFVTSGGTDGGLTQSGHQLVIDNMTIDIPEPAGASVFCALAGFVALRRRG